ncbi:class II fructose-1,6-bisphosphate aldolase [Alteribacillus sp. YIM 98480]|uniref:class II fructose-1,6-bisphosphate aldolase n=1 Tax=Alteribacillus sp. YIM 98480 TaxID=2606599 RepID=UPI00131AE543|nr:class II fructose-1,6-bisphosphate aldolase [Alteribacillus sp. YIM 98480]
MTEMLNKAKKEQYAVGQFNINNLEFAQGILLAAEEEQSPVICGLSKGAAKYMGGFQTAVHIVEGLMKDYDITVPVAIHLDHGSSVELCVEAIHAGVSSVMIDASHLPIEENIRITNEVLKIARVTGVSVEAEVGHVGAQDSGVITNPEEAYAKVEDCLKLIEETDVDCFAPALGSVHGPYKGEPHLAFDRMQEIHEKTDKPLVLHGGSGLPAQDIQRAISLGTSKINVNTENQIAATKTVREILNEKPELYDPRKYLGPAQASIKAVVQEKMQEFGSSKKASQEVSV